LGPEPYDPGGVARGGAAEARGDDSAVTLDVEARAVVGAAGREAQRCETAAPEARIERAGRENPADDHLRAGIRPCRADEHDPSLGIEAHRVDAIVRPAVERE